MFFFVILLFLRKLRMTISAGLFMIFLSPVSQDRQAVGINSGARKASLHFIMMFLLVPSLVFWISQENCFFFPLQSFMGSKRCCQRAMLWTLSYSQEHYHNLVQSLHSSYCSQVSKGMPLKQVLLVHSIVLKKALKTVLLINMDWWKSKTWGKTAKGLFSEVFSSIRG